MNNFAFFFSFVSIFAATASYGCYFRRLTIFAYLGRNGLNIFIIITYWYGLALNLNVSAGITAHEHWNI